MQEPFSPKIPVVPPQILKYAQIFMFHIIYNLKKLKSTYDFYQEHIMALVR